jgi:hypothetical protein
MCNLGCWKPVLAGLPSTLPAPSASCPAGDRCRCGFDTRFLKNATCSQRYRILTIVLDSPSFTPRVCAVDSENPFLSHGYLNAPATPNLSHNLRRASGFPARCCTLHAGGRLKSVPIRKILQLLFLRCSCLHK